MYMFKLLWCSASVSLSVIHGERKPPLYACIEELCAHCHILPLGHSTCMYNDIVNIGLAYIYYLSLHARSKIPNMKMPRRPSLFVVRRPHAVKLSVLTTQFKWV